MNDFEGKITKLETVLDEFKQPITELQTKFNVMFKASNKHWRVQEQWMDQLTKLLVQDDLDKESLSLVGAKQAI
jgi:hypothetical protein